MFIQYGDSLYGRKNYDGSVQQYIKTNFSNVHISMRSLKHTIQLSKALALINEKEYEKIVNPKKMITPS